MFGFYLVLSLLFVMAVVAITLNSRHNYKDKLKEKFQQGPFAEKWIKFKAAVRLVSGIAAVFFFVSALAINICSWFWKDYGRFTGWFGLLHIGILAVFFLAFASTPKGINGQRGAIDMPAPAAVFAKVLAAYTFLLFVFALINSLASHSTEHTQTVSAIELEKGAHQDLKGDLLALRFGTGIWMLFSFASAIQLLLNTRDRHGPFGKFNSLVKRL